MNGSRERPTIAMSPELHWTAENPKYAEPLSSATEDTIAAWARTQSIDETIQLRQDGEAAAYLCCQSLAAQALAHRDITRAQLALRIGLLPMHVGDGSRRDKHEGTNTRSFLFAAEALRRLGHDISDAVEPSWGDRSVIDELISRGRSDYPTWMYKGAHQLVERWGRTWLAVPWTLDRHERVLGWPHFAVAEQPWTPRFFPWTAAEPVTRLVRPPVDGDDQLRWRLADLRQTGDLDTAASLVEATKDRDGEVARSVWWLAFVLGGYEAVEQLTQHLTDRGSSGSSPPADLETIPQWPGVAITEPGRGPIFDRVINSE